MRDAGAATLLLAALVVTGCSAPTATEEQGVEPAFIPATTQTPVAAPAPPAADPALRSPCAFDPCSRVVADGFHAEPAVAISPADPERALVADFGTDGSHAGSWAYLSLTIDGGATWTSTRAPSVPALLPAPLVETAPDGIMTIVADTAAAWPEPETVLVVALLGETAFSPEWDYVRAIHLVQWRSTDAGRTWSEGTTLARAEGATGAIAGHPIHARWYDKPAIAHDAATGELHVLFHRIAAVPNGPFMLETLHITSRDAGASWSEPRAVPELDGLYGASLAAHEGTLLATLVNPGYRMFRSEDAGKTWTDLAEFSDKRPGSGTWQSAPVAFWDAGVGAIHAALVRSEGDKNERLILHLSQDAGKTWSNGTTLLPENATAVRNPVLAVDPTTGSGVIASYHADGAPDALATWGIPFARGIPQAAVRLNADPSGANVFEYFGAAVRGTTAIVAFPSNRPDATPLMAAALAVG